MKKKQSRNNLKPKIGKILEENLSTKFFVFTNCSCRTKVIFLFKNLSALKALEINNSKFNKKKWNGKNQKQMLITSLHKYQKCNK